MRRSGQTPDERVLRERISRYTQCGKKYADEKASICSQGVLGGPEQYSKVRGRKATYSHLSDIQNMWSRINVHPRGRNKPRGL